METILFAAQSWSRSDVLALIAIGLTLLGMLAGLIFMIWRFTTKVLLLLKEYGIRLNANDDQHEVYDRKLERLEGARH